MGFLAGKRILITGLLSKHSIAYGIAKACHREGAALAFTYQNERFLDRITKFATEFDSTLVFACDVADDTQIDKLFGDLATHWDGLDGLVHSIAYAPTEAIEGDFLDASRVKPSALPTTSRPTATRHSPRPRARCCSRATSRPCSRSRILAQNARCPTTT